MIKNQPMDKLQPVKRQHICGIPRVNCQLIYSSQLTKFSKTKDVVLLKARKQNRSLHSQEHMESLYWCEWLTCFAVAVRTCGGCGGDRLSSSMLQGPHLRRVVENRWIGRWRARSCSSNYVGRPWRCGGCSKTRRSTSVTIYRIPRGYLAARSSTSSGVYSSGSSSRASSTFRNSCSSRRGVPAINCRSSCSGGSIGTFGNPAWLGEEDRILAYPVSIHQVCWHVIPHCANNNPFQEHQAQSKANETNKQGDHTQPCLLARPNRTAKGTLTLGLAFTAAPWSPCSLRFLQDHRPGNSCPRTLAHPSLPSFMAHWGLTLR